MCEHLGISALIGKRVKDDDNFALKLLCSVVTIWEHIFITPILFSIDLTFAILLIALIKRRLANNIRVHGN